MFLIDAWKSEGPFDPESRLLRRFLLGNATFSTLTGTLCLVDAAPLTHAFGIPDPTLLPGLGVQLLMFAAAIVWIATRQNISARLAWVIIALDIGWGRGIYRASAIRIRHADVGRYYRNGPDCHWRRRLC